MKVKRLKEILESLDDEFEIFIRNSVNPLGNIQELEQVEYSSYGFFGTNLHCIILNTDSSKDLEMTDDIGTIDYIDNYKDPEK